MRVHELLHERQSDASPFMRAGLGAVDAVKAPEQLRDLVGGDAHSAVLNGQLSRAAGRQLLFPLTTFISSGLRSSSVVLPAGQSDRPKAGQKLCFAMASERA